MFRCECGCSEFSAHQKLRVDIVVDGNNNFIRNDNAMDDSLVIYDASNPYGPYTCNNCGKEYDELINVGEPITKDKEEPYLIIKDVKIKYQYNPNYGDQRVCVCGHTYERHFDTYEDMNAIGCKYCGCYLFVEKTEQNASFTNGCILCGKDTKDNTMVCNKCASEYKI